jgi:hypothetical protein
LGREAAGQPLGPARGIPNQAHGQLTHDGEQLGLHVAPELPFPPTRLRYLRVEALDGPFERVEVPFG